MGYIWALLILFNIIIIVLLYKLKQHTQEETEIKNKNKEILQNNKKLIEEKNSILNNITILENKLNSLKESNDNIKNISQKALEDYDIVLDNLYKTQEQEYDMAIEQLKESYNAQQDILLLKLNQAQQDLDKISQTRAAAIKAQLKEQEIKQEVQFYCPQINESDLKDVRILRDIEYKLNNPRILRMLIWSTFYQKPMNQVCANVLGGSTIVKCGIYKITNQITNLCYIGQSKDIATRWKNHAKAGLGIDTPAGNKLYKAMQEDGLENFSFELLEECAANELNEKEAFYINLYQADNYGYNLTSGNK